MRISDKRWKADREKIARRDEEPERPMAPSGRPYHEVRCHKCGALLGFVERMMPGDYMVLPPGESPSEMLPEVSSPAPADPRVIPAGAGTVILWCQKCKQRRFTHSPLGPQENGKR